MKIKHLINNITKKARYALKRVPIDEKVKLNSYSIYLGHHKVTYKGIKAIRCPFDYVIYQMIITDLKPDLIIEIGTNEGGGAVYLADLLDLNGKGTVHAIDIDNRAEEAAKSHPRIKLFTNGWDGYDIENAKGFETILVIEDAAHTYECTLGAIEKFANLVSKNSYLIVEDGIVNKLGMEEAYQGGPLKAIREFLPTHPEFQVDRKWCDLFGKNATFNVNGYLKKIS